MMIKTPLKAPVKIKSSNIKNVKIKSSNIRSFDVGKKEVSRNLQHFAPD